MRQTMTMLSTAGALCLACAAFAQEARPTVRTTQGQLQGRAASGVSAFLGIPYGADTGGANRFLPPKPAAAWTGTRQADKMGNRCPQPAMNKPAGTPQVIIFSELPTGEDCLVLNVWTPATQRAKKRPVMVWLHGGAYAFGSASDRYYAGGRLAKTQDVVVVTLNHRLNGFGYLNLGTEAGRGYASAAVNGNLDIVEALRWVRANIAAFGGDPGNVTIFGQSGGGGKVTTLTAMPSAAGLFHKAIVQSGSTPRIATMAASLAVRDKVLAELKIEPRDVARLRDMPMADLVAAFAKSGLLSYGPAVDGLWLPTQPFDPASLVSANVPMLVGTARDEATSLLLADPSWQTMTDADAAARFAAVLGADRGAEALALYRARAPGDKPMHHWASLVTDQSFTHNAQILATRKAAQRRAPVYAYRIDWQSPVLGGILRAPHGVDLPFVFDTADVSRELVGEGASQDAMTRLMGSTFAAFARTGNPSVRGQPSWPAYDPGRRATFIYDVTPRVVSDPEPTIRAFWNKVAGEKGTPGTQ